MTDPNLKTKVVHSLTNDAYNVVGKTAGKKFKIARCPYITIEGDDNPQLEAFNHAEFISYCFNNSIKILSNQKQICLI